MFPIFTPEADKNDKKTEIEPLALADSPSEIDINGIFITIKHDTFFDDEHSSTIDVFYPQIEGGSDNEHAEKLNSEMKTTAYWNITEETIQTQFNTHIETKCHITYYDESIISVLFSIELDLPMTSNEFYSAITFSTESFNKIALDDLEISIEDLIMESNNIKVSYLNESLDYADKNVRRQLYTDFVAYTSPINNYYLSENHIGLILSVGGPNPAHVLFEVPCTWQWQGNDSENHPQE